MIANILCHQSVNLETQIKIEIENLLNKDRRQNFKAKNTSEEIFLAELLTILESALPLISKFKITQLACRDNSHHRVFELDLYLNKIIIQFKLHFDPIENLFTVQEL